MDGQVKEARGQQLRTLDLHPVEEDVGPRMLDEIRSSAMTRLDAGESMSSLSIFKPGINVPGYKGMEYITCLPNQKPLLF